MTPRNEIPQTTFWDHLEVLRWALLRSCGVLILAAIALFVAMPTLFDRVILAPTRADFILYRLIDHFAGSALIGGQVDFSLQNIHIAAQFTTHISASLWGALLVAFPYLMAELWYFIRPALYPTEKRGVRGALIVCSMLFVLGCVTGYLVVFPLTFRFLASYQLSAEIANQITLHSYMGNLMGVIFVMGLAFELPVATWLMSKLGILSAERLRSGRRYAVVALLILSAIITPSGDPFTLLVVFLPLYLLYEAGILCARSDKS